MIFLLVCLIGATVLIKPFINLLISVLFHFRTLNLKQKYGEGWAVVTGATDGIGFGFCQELAAQGYNICLISRSPEKLNAKIQQLRLQFGNKIQYKAIKADFTESHLQGFFERIEKQLDSIQPVILVNNVGISQVISINDQKLESMRNIIAVNCLPMAALSSYFINRCKKDRRKGGIVNISSYSCVIPMPYLSVYASTKAFNDIFSRSSYIQEKNTVDILSVRAMMVISGAVKRQKSFTVITSRECALGSLKYLGYTDYTAGHFRHQVIANLTQLLPEFVLKKIAVQEATKVYHQLKAKKD